MQFAGLNQDALHIRMLQDSPSDIATMAKWLSDPSVLAFYDGRDNPFDENRIRESYISKIGTGLTPCIVEHQGKSIGYIQFYPLEPGEYGFPPGPVIYGLDQFIGEPDYWNRGIGTHMVSMVIRYLFETAGAHRVVLDPHVENHRAIRCYEKCGFRKVELLPQHELHEGKWVDCWLMEVTPDRLTPAAGCQG